MDKPARTKYRITVVFLLFCYISVFGKQSGAFFLAGGCPGFMISSLTSEDVSCHGDSDGRIQLSVTGGTAPYSYSVDGGLNFQSFSGSEVLISGLASGNYQISVMDFEGCLFEFAMNPVEIHEPEVLVASVEIIERGCFNTSDGDLGVVASGGTPPYSYLWSFGATNAIIEDLSPAFYSVTVTDSRSCQLSAGILYQNFPLIQVNAGPDVTIEPGESVLLSASTDAPDPFEVQWTPIEGLSAPQSLITEASPSVSTQYVITVTTPEGCFGLTAVNVFIDPGDGKIHVPNAFTPNDDGRNDLFRPLFTGPADLVRIRIFNRWGQEVYQSSSSQGWDGSFLGVPQAPGTYAYSIIYENEMGEEKEIRGGFHLIR